MSIMTDGVYNALEAVKLNKVIDMAPTVSARECALNVLKKYILDKNGGLTPPAIKWVKEFVANGLQDTEAQTVPGQWIQKVLLPYDDPTKVLEAFDKQNEMDQTEKIEFMQYRIYKNLYKQQKDVLTDATLPGRKGSPKQVMVITSRRVGKTELNGALLDYVCCSPGVRCVYMNITHTMAWDQIGEVVERYKKIAGLGDISEDVADDSYGGVARGINFPNGSSILVTGMANAGQVDKLRGYKANLIICDEACHIPGFKYILEEVVTPMTVDYGENATIVISGTPSRFTDNYVSYLWHTPDNGWQKYHWNMIQNPFLPNPLGFIRSRAINRGIKFATEDPTEQEIRDALAVNSPDLLREYFGEFAIDESAQVFHGYKSSDIDIDNTYINRIVIGCDFGFRDNNAIILIGYNDDTEDCHAYTLDEDLFNGAGDEEIISRIKKMWNKAIELADKKGINRSSITIYTDSNQPSLTSDLRGIHHLPVINAYKLQKIEAMERLAVLTRAGKVIIGNNCKELKHDLDNTVYVRDDLGNLHEELDEEVYHGDMIMAFLYAMRQPMIEMKYYLQPNERYDGHLYNTDEKGDIQMDDPVKVSIDGYEIPQEDIGIIG